ncbi:MAG: N-acetylmuramoyl-L-alanine amidase [Pyrinomonadaceae bacterium]
MSKANEINAKQQPVNYDVHPARNENSAPAILTNPAGASFFSPTAYLERVGFDAGKYRRASLDFKQPHAAAAKSGRSFAKPPVSRHFTARVGTYGSRHGTDIDAIILHHTAGSTAAGAYEAMQSRGLSVHYIVDKDGKIYQMVGDEKRAYHAGVGKGKWANVNSRSIGIEIVNLGNGKDKYTGAQYRALEKLVPYLAHKYNIAVKNIVGHSQIGNENRPADHPEPSRNFDWNRIRQSVADGGAPAPNTKPPKPSPHKSRITAPTAFLRRGNRSSQVKKLQNALVKLKYMTRAQVNTGPGIFGPRTEHALKMFQRDHRDVSGHRLVVDGIYGPKTRGALRRALQKADTKPQPKPPSHPPTSGGKVDINNIVGVKNNPNVTPAFKREVNAIAKRLGTKPEYLLAVMSFESGLNPKAVNGVSGATGLIQFLPGTAHGLGTSTSALKNMSSVEQLKFVEKYLKPFKGRLGTLEGVYTSVLSGSPHPNSSDVLFRRGTAAYSQNKGLDFNGDGRITSGEATSAVAAKMFGGTRAVQQRLKNLGFNPKGVDGVFGPNTSKAIATFQRSRKLPVTGLLNERTGLTLFNVKVRPPKPAPGKNGKAPTYKRWEVYSTGDSAARHADGYEDLQPHHGPAGQWTNYVSRSVGLNHNLLKRDIVLTRPGQSNLGQTVPSPIKGKVLYAGNENDGYGNKVVVKNESTGQIIMVGHLESIGVHRGQSVSYGQKLGGQGSTGHSTGAHVHINADPSVIKRWVADLADGKFDGVRMRFDVGRRP